MPIGQSRKTALRQIADLYCKTQTSRPEIDLVRKRLIDVLFVVAGVFSGIPIGLGMVRADLEAEPLFSIVYFLLLVALLAGVVLRHRLAYNVKVWLLLGLIEAWGIASLLRLGFTGMGFTFLTAVVVLAAPLLGGRSALVALLFGGAAITAVGIAHVSGAMPIDPNTVTTLLHASAWVNACLLFLLFAVMLTSSSQVLMARLEYTLRQVEAHAAALEIAKQAVSESESRFRDLAELLPEIVFEIDLEGRFTFVNRAGFVSFGYTDGVLPPGASVWDMIHPDDRAAVRRAMARIGEGQRSGLNEYRGVRRDGSELPILVNTAAIFRASQMVGMRGIVLDISEKKMVEARLRQSQKLEAVGRLAAGVAHDLNNILTGIRGRVTLAREPAYSETVAEHLDHVDEFVNSAALLTRQLLAFGRGGSYESHLVNVSELARRTLAMFGRTQKRLSITMALEDHIWAVMADAGQLEQVLINMLLNADQAIPATGAIHLATRNCLLDETRAAALHMAPGICVCIDVRDTGVGIAPTDLPQIFEPFFSTRALPGTRDSDSRLLMGSWAHIAGRSM